MFSQGMRSADGRTAPAVIYESAFSLGVLLGCTVVGENPSTSPTTAMGTPSIACFVRARSGPVDGRDAQPGQWGG